MLGMVKMTYPEIRQAVLAVEDDKLEENLLVQLSNYVPTPEEVRLHQSKRGFINIQITSHFSAATSVVPRRSKCLSHSRTRPTSWPPRITSSSWYACTQLQEQHRKA